MGRRCVFKLKPHNIGAGPEALPCAMPAWQADAAVLMVAQPLRCRAEAQASLAQGVAAGLSNAMLAERLGWPWWPKSSPRLAQCISHGNWLCFTESFFFFHKTLKNNLVSFVSIFFLIAKIIGSS